jgi:hypothetical protein
MNRAACIVISEPLFEIIRYTHIPLVLVLYTDDEINVMHTSLGTAEFIVG